MQATGDGREKWRTKCDRNRWNRLPDSVDFTSLLCFKRSLDTIDFSLLLNYYSFACFVFCVVCICMGSC